MSAKRFRLLLVDGSTDFSLNNELSTAETRLFKFGKSNASSYPRAFDLIGVFISGNSILSCVLLKLLRNFYLLLSAASSF